MHPTRVTIVLVLVCFLVPAVFSHAEMAMPEPGATPNLGPGMGLDTQGLPPA
jgi:hypothetical protein